MQVTQKTIDALHKTFQRRAEQGVCEQLVRAYNLSAHEALDMYYNSRVCKVANSGNIDILYLSPILLAQEIYDEAHKA